MNNQNHSSHDNCESQLKSSFCEGNKPITAYFTNCYICKTHCSELSSQPFSSGSLLVSDYFL